MGNQEKFSYPPLEREVTVSLGENLLRQGLSSEVRAIDVYNEVSISLANLMPNKYIQTGYVGSSTDKAIFQPEDKGRAFSSLLSSAMLVVNENANLALIYTGKVDNRIRFTYREFSGNTARMPFSTEVEYDLNENNIISYQGATIEVIKANNRSVTYKVMSNFRNYD